MLPQTELKKKELNTVLSNSFGFGGNCSAVIFSKEA
jgi:3-oxoacyl-[acyl-carrier-protein] synthase-1